MKLPIDYARVAEMMWEDDGGRHKDDTSYRCPHCGAVLHLVCEDGKVKDKAGRGATSAAGEPFEEKDDAVRT